MENRKEKIYVDIEVYRDNAAFYLSLVDLCLSLFVLLPSLLGNSRKCRFWFYWGKAKSIL